MKWKLYQIFTYFNIVYAILLFARAIQVQFSYAPNLFNFSILSSSCLIIFLKSFLGIYLFRCYTEKVMYKKNIVLPFYILYSLHLLFTLLLIIGLVISFDNLSARIGYDKLQLVFYATSLVFAFSSVYCFTIEPALPPLVRKLSDQSEALFQD